MKKIGMLFTVLCLALFFTVAVQAEAPGRTVSVVLEENPSTGYGWTYTMSPDGNVREVSSDYVQDPGTENIMGAWGKRTWVFEATAQGDTLLHFTYARPTEAGVPPAREIFFLFRADQMLNFMQRGNVEASGSYVFISLSENPTTGYQWQVAPSAEGILNQEGDEFVPAGTLDGMVGAGGTHVWRFAAAAAGEVTLNFTQARSFEVGEADALSLSFSVDTGLNATLRAAE